MKRLALLMVMVCAACGDDGNTPDARVMLPDGGAADAASPDAGSPDAGMTLAQRGDYLVNHVLLCVDCHTPRNPDGSFDSSRHLAGVDCFIDIDPANADVGCLSSRNLTPHATGLGTRTDDQIKTMMTTGVRPGGGFLAPVMPYWLMHRLTADDQNAIVAYLKTVPAVDHQIPAQQPPWNNLPAAAPPVADSMFPAAGGSGDTLASAQRGRYFATMVCLDCHTPDAAPGGPYPIDLTKMFMGNRAFPLGPPFGTVYTTNLTPHATGLAGWTVAQVVTALKQGRDNQNRGICPPMPSGPMGPFAGLTDADATDIANYVLNLPARENTITAECVLPGPP